VAQEPRRRQRGWVVVARDVPLAIAVGAAGAADELFADRY